MSSQAKVRLTAAQALIKFLSAQYIEVDGEEGRFFTAGWGIFGHGNVAGLGQAILESGEFRYHVPRNEQAMVLSRRCLRQVQKSNPRDVLYLLHRPRRDQYDNRCRRGHREPPAGSNSAGRHLRAPQRSPSPPTG